jgi:tetratricopeptide (TPR) repeat protein
MFMLNKKTTCILICLFLSQASRSFSAAETKWIEVRSPHFTVISDASSKTARQTIFRYEQFRMVLGKVMPKYKIDSGIPLTIFAARNEASMKMLLTSGRPPEGGIMPVGFYLASDDRDYAVIETDIHIDQAYPILYKGYAGRILRLNFKSLPYWLQVGLSEFYGQAVVEDKSAALACANDAYLYYLRNRPLLPWEQIFSTTGGDSYRGDRTKWEMFHAQAWALTHYLQLEGNRQHAPQLNLYMGLIKKGTDSVEAAKQAFGDFAALNRDIGTYASRILNQWKLPAQIDLKETDYTERVLSSSEEMAIRGTLLIINNHKEEGRSLLQQALKLDPKSAQGNEGMALLSLRNGDQSQAEQYFTAAAELGSHSFLAYYFAAHTALSKRSNISEALACLDKSLALNPEFSQSKELKTSLLKGMNSGSALNNPPSKADEASETPSHNVIENSEEIKALEAQQAGIREAKRLEKTGAEAVLEGLVRSTTCKYPAIMDLEIVSGSHVQKLRSKNYQNVQYYVVNENNNTAFDPCKDLQGKTVSARYLSTEGSDYSGLVQSIEIRK